MTVRTLHAGTVAGVGLAMLPLAGRSASQETPAPMPAAPAPAASQPAAPAQPTTPAPAAPLPAAPPARTDSTTPTSPAPAGEALSLQQAIDFAVRNNPVIGGAAAEVRQARARVTQARAVRLPQAGINGNIFRQGPVLPAFSPGANPIVPPYRWTTGIFLSQVIFDWGQRHATQRANERLTRSAEFRLSETQNNVRLVVSVAFYNVFRAEELLRVAREREQAATEQLRVAQARFESDVAPRFDVIRTEAELANAREEVIIAQNDIALSEAAFNTALGREVTTDVALEQSRIPDQLAELTFEQARDTAIAQRPQLQALREQIEADKQNVRAARAGNKPQVSLGAGYDRRTATGLSAGYSYNFGLNLTFPFFDSGLTRGRVREAQAIVETDRAALEQARQQLELDIRQAQLDVGEARQRIETARKEQQSAREALRVAEVRYQAGVGTNVEVTDAQVALARAGQNLANAQFDYSAAVARLEFAIGVPVAAGVPEGTKAAPAAEAAKQ